MGKKKEIRIELSEAEINRLIDKIESSNLSEEDSERVISMLEALVKLNALLDLKETTIARLRKIFNKQSEKRKAAAEKTPVDPKPGKNNGRNGKDDYPIAEEILHEHEDLEAGDKCESCGKGTLYRYEPGIYVKITGSSPLTATIHRTEKLRCSACGEIFEANFKGREDPKYDAKAKAVVALLKYGASTPFYRLEKIQKGLLTPLPASTQWDLMEELANDLWPAWKALITTAAQSGLSHIDDTTAKVLNLMKDNRLEQNRGTKKKRFGLWTTGLLSELGENRRVVLYFTGSKYAGENLDEFLDHRDSSLGPMIIMSDALSTNHPKRHEIYQGLCNVHGRRGFKDLADKYKQESEHVLSLIGLVYKHEKHTVTEKMTPDERQIYHDEHSGAVMDTLHDWCEAQFIERKVEPNSSLGKGIQYILKHWVELTQFCRVPGVPLDNNVLEEKLRLPVLNRKNFLFYRSEHGALVGDIIMGLIKTCDVNRINALEYMAAVQDHADAVRANPAAWLPWNFQKNLETQTAGEKASPTPV